MDVYGIIKVTSYQLRVPSSARPNLNTERFKDISFNRLNELFSSQIVLIFIFFIIIPQSMRAEMTSQAHHSLLRIQYTMTTVRDIMYWPRMSADLAEAEEV